MPDVQLNGIEFVIKGETAGAVVSIDRLRQALSKLQKVNDGNQALKQLSKDVREFAKAINSIDLQKLDAFSASIGAVTKSARGAGSGARGVASGIKDVSTSAKKAATPLSTFVSSLKRIAFYRILRSILKSISQAFQEGLKNAYEFSKATGDQAGLAKALDDLATKSLTMKNQLGAAFGGLLTALMPIILKIIQFVTKLAEAITRLIAILGGSDTYLRAKDVWTEWGDAAQDAGGKAKKALEYLAPFDELNVLPDPKNGGSGSGSAANVADMFEYVKTNEGNGFLDSIKGMLDKVKDFFETTDWGELANKAWQKLKEAFSNKDKATGVIQSLFETLGAVIGGAARFILQFAHNLVSDVLKKISNNIKDYNGDGKLTKVDFLVAILKTGGDMIKWVYNTFVEPFINGLIRGFTGDKKFDLSDWAKEKLYKPMIKWLNAFIDKFNKIFKTNLPKVEVGVEIGEVGISSDVEVNSGSGGWFGGGLGGLWAKVKGVITKFTDNTSSSDKTVSGVKGVMDWIVDKVPFAQKLIDGIRGNMTKVTDNIPKSEKVVNSTQAIMTTASNQIPKTYLTIGVSASFATAVNKLSTGQTTFNSTADFKKAQDQMNASSKTFLSTARMQYVESALTDKQKTFDSTAKVKNYVLDGMSTYDGKMRVSSIIDIKGQANVPTIAVDIAPSTSGGSASPSGKPNSSFSVKANGGAFYGGLWHSIAQYASGGFPNHGSLFVAGENGSELVSNINGRTEVLNQSQIASAVASGVSRYLAMGAADGGNEDAMYRAFKRALDETDFGGDVELDGQTLYKAMVNRNRQNTRLTGVNAMA